jgi:hypothetical protein
MTTPLTARTPLTSVYVGGRCIGFVLCRGPDGFEPCDAEGASIAPPFSTIDAACAAVQALGVHQPADGD